MNIQSLSIVVPTKSCVNSCEFCCSCMHDNNYEHKTDWTAMRRRIRHAQKLGADTCIITGTGEAFQNKPFLLELGNLFKSMDYPFDRVELQTSGSLLLTKPENMCGPNGDISILRKLGISTISFSVSDLFDNDNNMKIMNVPEKIQFSLEYLTSKLKSLGFNIRLSLNMTNVYDDKHPKDILEKCKSLNADQVTFRKFYHNNDNSKESRWVVENECNPETLIKLKHYITGRLKGDGFGEKLYRLPFGGEVYSIMGMSTVIDNDCMSKNVDDVLKYLIIRENCKLYCRWDDEGSLIF